MSDTMREALERWAKAESFETWAEDHAAVLRNLAAWLGRESALAARPEGSEGALEYALSEFERTEPGHNEDVYKARQDLSALRARAEKAEGEVEVLREGIALARAHLILAWKRAWDLDGVRAKISHVQLVLDSAMLGKPAEEALAGKGE